MDSSSPSSSSLSSPPPPRRLTTTRLGKGGEEDGRDKPSRKAPLKILCFGDSLTAGTPAEHPYGGRLEERLEDALPHLAPICEVDGLPGAKVTPGLFRKRMERAWARAAADNGSSGSSYRKQVDGGAGAGEGRVGGDGAEDGQQQQREPEYHWTIVLGGTNDLGWRVSAADIIEGLKETWDVPLRRGGKVLALTVPEIRDAGPLDEVRDEVNAAIKAYDRPNL